MAICGVAACSDREKLLEVAVNVLRQKRQALVEELTLLQGVQTPQPPGDPLPAASVLVPKPPTPPPVASVLVPKPPGTPPPAPTVRMPKPPSTPPPVPSVPVPKPPGTPPPVSKGQKNPHLPPDNDPITGKRRARPRGGKNSWWYSLKDRATKEGWPSS